MIPLINTSFKFSCYENLLSVKEPVNTVDINGLIEIIKFGYLKGEIRKLRNASSKKEYADIKRTQLPAVTLSGIFTYRRNSDLVNHSGLIQVDLDKVDKYDSLFTNICQDSYTYVAFRSPGGEGIKVIVKISPSSDSHLGQYLALEEYYLKTFGVGIDGACKDLSRAMLLSYDPKIFCNPHAKVFERIKKLLKPQKTFHPDSKVVFQYETDQFEKEAQIVEEIISQTQKLKIDLTDTYDKWWRIGMAIVNTFGSSGRQYFHSISSIHENYSAQECDSLFSQLLKKNTGQITLGTLIHYAREAGMIIDSLSDQKENVD